MKYLFVLLFVAAASSAIAFEATEDLNQPEPLIKLFNLFGTEGLVRNKRDASCAINVGTPWVTVNVPNVPNCPVKCRREGHSGGECVNGSCVCTQPQPAQPAQSAQPAQTAQTGQSRLQPVSCWRVAHSGPFENLYTNGNCNRRCRLEGLTRGSCANGYCYCS